MGPQSRSAPSLQRLPSGVARDLEALAPDRRRVWTRPHVAWGHMGPRPCTARPLLRRARRRTALGAERAFHVRTIRSHATAGERRAMAAPSPCTGVRVVVWLHHDHLG